MLRNIRKTFKQSAQIQSCADGEDRQAVPPSQVLQNLQSHLAVAAGGCVVPRPKNVNQVMRYAAALGRGGFCSTNVKAAIELRRIASHHFSAEPFRKLDAERRLYISRRNCDGHEGQERFAFAHRKRRCRARTKRKMSTNSARRRLPKTCWRGTFTFAGNKTREGCCRDRCSAARYKAP